MRNRWKDDRLKSEGTGLLIKLEQSTASKRISVLLGVFRMRVLGAVGYVKDAAGLQSPVRIRYHTCAARIEYKTMPTLVNPWLQLNKIKPTHPGSKAKNLTLSLLSKPTVLLKFILLNFKTRSTESVPERLPIRLASILKSHHLISRQPPQAGYTQPPCFYLPIIPRQPDILLLARHIIILNYWVTSQLWARLRFSLHSHFRALICLNKV